MLWATSGPEFWARWVSSPRGCCSGTCGWTCWSHRVHMHCQPTGLWPPGWNQGASMEGGHRQAARHGQCQRALRSSALPGTSGTTSVLHVRFGFVWSQFCSQGWQASCLTCGPVEPWGSAAVWPSSAAGGSSRPVLGTLPALSPLGRPRGWGTALLSRLRFLRSPLSLQGWLILDPCSLSLKRGRDCKHRSLGSCNRSLWLSDRGKERD